MNSSARNVRGRASRPLLPLSAAVLFQFVAELIIVIIPRPFKSRIKSDRFLRFGIRLLIAPVHQIGKKVAQHGFRVGMHVLGSPAYAREMGDSQRTPERPISISGICAGLI